MPPRCVLLQDEYHLQTTAWLHKEPGHRGPKYDAPPSFVLPLGVSAVHDLNSYTGLVFTRRQTRRRTLQDMSLECAIGAQPQLAPYMVNKDPLCSSVPASKPKRVRRCAILPSSFDSPLLPPSFTLHIFRPRRYFDPSMKPQRSQLER